MFLCLFSGEFSLTLFGMVVTNKLFHQSSLLPPSHHRHVYLCQSFITWHSRRDWTVENLKILSSDPFLSTMWQAYTAESRMIFRLDLVIVLKLKKNGERREEIRAKNPISWLMKRNFVRDEKKGWRKAKLIALNYSKFWYKKHWYKKQPEFRLKLIIIICTRLEIDFHCLAELSLHPNSVWTTSIKSEKLAVFMYSTNFYPHFLCQL